MASNKVKNMPIMMSVAIIACILIVSMYIYLEKEPYTYIKNWLTADSQEGIDYFYRGISTNLDLWKNGYLGIFFRFKMFGIFNWLAIPIFIYFLITIKEREKREIAIWLAVSLSCIILCFLGYKNYRYQLTLYPMILSIVAIFYWKHLRRVNKKIRYLIAAIFIIMLANNIYALKNNYWYYFKSAIGAGEPGEGFPSKMIEYINDQIEKDASIWENNQPILYYYTSKKGYSYYNKKAKYALARGKVKLSRKNVGLDLIFEDQGYKLYAIKNISEFPVFKDYDKLMPEYEIDLSFDGKVFDDSGKNPEKALAPMKILGKRGEFTVELVDNNEVKSIRIKPISANFNERPEIQIGFFIHSENPNYRLKGGEVISFLAKLKTSGKIDAGIFVQDKTDYWSREEKYVEKKTFEDLLVRKRIREGATNICIGIEFNPKSNEDFLEIISARVFIE